MNEEISVTLRNNTNQVQPVILFTETFAIPNNLTGGQTQIYSWDVSNDSFFWGNNILFPLPTAQIQISSSPITNTTPYTNTGVLSTNNVAGLINVLNALGQGTFTNVNNVISVTNSGNLFYGNLILSPSILVQVTSNTVSVYNAIDVFINGNLDISFAGGITGVTTSFNGTSGDNILVQYGAGVGAINWNIGIDWVQPNNVFTNLFTNSGLGSVLSTYSFIYPNVGNILITLNINP